MTILQTRRKSWPNMKALRPVLRSHLHLGNHADRGRHFNEHPNHDKPTVLWIKRKVEEAIYIRRQKSFFTNDQRHQLFVIYNNLLRHLWQTRTLRDQDCFLSSETCWLLIFLSTAILCTFVCWLFVRHRYDITYKVPLTYISMPIF